MARNKKEEKGSIIPFVFCIVALALTVSALPFMDSLFMKKYEPATKKEEEKNKMPTGYSCSYGPAYDEFYKYTKDEDVEFKFDKEGNATQIVSSASYSTLTLNEYQVILNDLTTKYGTENITAEATNYTIIVKQNTTNISSTEYPIEYSKLKNYLSQNGYICSEK